MLDVRISLSIAFLAIADRSAILDFRNSLLIAILAISDRYRIFFFRQPFWMSENHFGSHFWPFQIDRQLYFCRPFWMGRQCQLSNSSRDIWMSNACVKFEQRSLNPSKVIALTKLCGGGRPRGGGCVADENIIFLKTYVSREYNETRLLGRPQPQMYPPVALNQHTLVNRTHKHYIYICLKAPQTS